MKTICLLKLKSGKRLDLKISDSQWNMLAVYKIFFPPTTVIKFGEKKIPLKEIFPWPPPKQSSLMTVAPIEKKKDVDMG